MRPSTLIAFIDDTDAALPEQLIAISSLGDFPPFKIKGMPLRNMR